jgi:hypothetical protein
MKIKELTIEQFNKWKSNNCWCTACESCPFAPVNCHSDMLGWIHFKDIFSEDFLNQEVE